MAADDGRLTIYISSTFSDLADYRRATHDVLRKMGHDVRAMEDYIAQDERPVDYCVRDVKTCDLYVGIFAWRYGYVPRQDNPEQKSVTQMEFEAAREHGIPCLVFMLADDSPWPPSQMDAKTGDGEAGKKIDAFRGRLGEDYMASFFANPEQLASQVGVAVATHSQQRLAVQRATVDPEVALPTELADTRRLGFGTTLLPDIAERIASMLETAESARLGEVDLGEGDVWWSTRLLLLAALIDDYTEIEQLLILGVDKELIGLATPSAVRRSLAAVHPSVSEAYEASARSVTTEVGSQAVQAVVSQFSIELGQLAESEESIKELVSPARVKNWLGAELINDDVARDGQPLGPSVYRQILLRRSGLVPVTNSYRLEAVVDRHRLANDIALGVLATAT
ncbi:MAG: DUF4062 domain-containing protein [Ilumatobacter sp.]|uniref:DUF4062 domain-containing protein n=1 Tax=Ilumatobacter sp. TaxID=1967498 RepID=UPI002615D770|nr:DUF4062 domain-containing protein [Ilumatobacter sp.]MDJ0768368.1 DUF4062 domain-containing protein [Ilumatobacter sp.]